MSTPKNRPGNEVQPAIEAGPIARAGINSEAVPFKRSKTALGRMMFLLVLVIASVLLWIILGTIGGAVSTVPGTTEKNPLGPLLYPTPAGFAVGIYSAVVMAYPIGMAAWRLMNKHVNQFEVVRLVFAAITIVVGLLWVDDVLVAWQDFGFLLWADGKLLGLWGIVAILAHAISAYVLTLYKEDDPSLREIEEELPTLKLVTAQSLLDLKGRLGVQTRRRERHENLETGLKSLQETAKEKSAALDTATKAYNESADVKKLAEVNQKLTTANSDLNQLLVGIAAREPSVKEQEDPVEKKTLEKELTDMIDQRKKLRSEIKAHEAKIDKLKPKIKKSDVKVNLESAKKASKKASDAVSEYNKGLDIPLANKKKADEDVVNAGGDSSAATAELATAEQTLEVANQKAAKLWRDRFFVAFVIPFVLWGIAIVCYTSWYGWMLSEFTS